MQPTGDPGRELARRLRSLREHWRLTQPQLAKALSVSVALISGWESQKATPPLNRLEAYATFFASERSKGRDGAVRLLPEAQLTAEEREERKSLLSELLTLRSWATQDANLPPRTLPPDGSKLSAIGGGLWHFPDRRDVTIVCAPLSEQNLSKIPYADPRSPDYVDSYKYADLDALIELYGHLRATNPHNQVNIRLASDVTGDHMTNHLILLGGVDWNHLTRHLQEVWDPPVRQVSGNPDDPTAWDAWFEVQENGKSRQFRPRLDRSGAHEVLLEDVAHFYRAISPFNTRRTITVCNGTYGLGTYGAVRTLTDAKFRDRNEQFVAERFQDRQRFSVLMRVSVVNNQVITPDWTQARMRLHEWPEVGQ